MSPDSKKDKMKDIILKLHQGLSAEAAKDQFEREIGSVTSTEIAAMEQSLIDEGLSPDEIKKFCNVHALIFESALTNVAMQETSPSHPVFLFKAENREIEKLTARLSTAGRSGGIDTAKHELRQLLQELKGINTHYERKEQLLFPYLEKQGFTGPSKVMWEKDREVRGMLKAANEALALVESSDGLTAYLDGKIGPLIAEINGMVFKEDNILLPASMEKLSAADWVEILKESDDIGYVFIKKPRETEQMIRELRSALVGEPVVKDGSLAFPTGIVGLNELLAILNTLPVDITFVDRNDTVRYFSDSKDRVFRRTKAIIGRNVQNCHPPQSIEVVNKILSSFKEGRKNTYEFWIDMQGRFIHIRYFALRNATGEYLGTMEVTQDATGLRKLEGQRRLLDEGN